jgi:MFS family permease
MPEVRPPKSRIVTALIAGAFLFATAVATVLILWLGDWDRYHWGLDLTLRILWGCCIVAVAATLLTRLTIIGWYFRRYFRPAEQPPPDPVSGGPRRTVRAPWYKSPALSFSMTVTLVSLTGATAIASAVIWIMGDVFGDWLMWLILKIIWGVFWIVCIAIVLTRVGVFRLHMLKAKRAEPPAAGPPGQESERPPPGPPQRSSDQLSLE